MGSGTPARAWPYRISDDEQEHHRRQPEAQLGDGVGPPGRTSRLPTQPATKSSVCTTMSSTLTHPVRPPKDREELGKEARLLADLGQDLALLLIGSPRRSSESMSLIVILLPCRTSRSFCRAMHQSCLDRARRHAECPGHLGHAHFPPPIDMKKGGRQRAARPCSCRSAARKPVDVGGGTNMGRGFRLPSGRRIRAGPRSSRSGVAWPAPGRSAWPQPRETMR